MAKKLNLSMFIFIILLFSANLKAGELTFGWNKINESGNIWDMEFIPDNNYFIFGTTTDLQIRNTETGELVNSYPFGAGQIEFTPDSTRLIIISFDDSLSKLQIRNIIDMSLIKEYVLPRDTDTSGYSIESSSIGFMEIAVDPIRPFIYALRSREGILKNGNYFHIRKIMIYNYETMEEVGVMPVAEGENRWLNKMAISKDGKYLAINSDGESILKVWDLNTRKEIRTFKLCEKSGESTCTKFSELNTGLIYFSGEFPQVNTFHNGLFIYSISDNRLIDTTFGTGQNRVYRGYFTLFDNEERVIKLIGNFIAILNLKNKIIEQKIDRDTISNGPVIFGRTIYSNNKKIFLGYGNEYFCHIKNNLNTGIEDPLHYDSIIFPNPNTGIITLKTDCLNPNQTYEIININGLVIIPITIIPIQSGNTTINISALQAGTYFLKYNCGSSLTTYKIIKED